MIDFDLPTVEVDLQQLLDGMLEIGGQQESRLAIIQLAALTLAVGSGRHYLQSQWAPARAAAGTHDQSRAPAVLLRKRQVELQRGVARERSHYRVFHDSNDGDRGTRRSAEIRRDNPLADGVAARPKTPRESFVHDASARRIGTVIGAEFASLQDRDAQRAKKSGRNHIVVHAQAELEVVALERL